MKKFISFLGIITILLMMNACKNNEKEVVQDETPTYKGIDIQKRLAKYVPFTLTTDLSHLSDNQKEMLLLLFQAADIMNGIYWEETYGDKEELLSKIEDEDTKKYIAINYGPWDILEENVPFITEIGQKPLGANFYPVDMTVDEFNAFPDSNKNSGYTLIRRDDEGKLKVVWYHEQFKEEVENAAALLRQAADLAEDEGFKNYLIARADALLTDDYYNSDVVWMEMKDNLIDFVIGPIESYEDALFNKKTSHESFILIKDVEWSKKLEKYNAMLADLQEGLPVDNKYKAEVPGSKGQLNAYDVIYYAGNCNAGSKTIAINLPNDERIHSSHGTRRLQLKNVMKAKFDKVLLPISEIVIDPEQRSHVTFDAFFSNTMFHEVAHGMGINYVIGDPDHKTVTDALLQYSTTLEEGKADILGLYLVTKLYEMGELGEVDLMDYYVTFMTSIFRSARFGSASSHGKANMMRFDYFLENGAFTKDEISGFYKINFEKMQEVVSMLTEKILVIQGDGDFKAAEEWVTTKGVVSDDLQADLDKINSAGIPVDIIYNQGPEVVGLK